MVPCSTLSTMHPSSVAGEKQTAEAILSLVGSFIFSPLISICAFTSLSRLLKQRVALGIHRRITISCCLAVILAQLEYLFNFAGEDIQTNGLLENSDLLIQCAVADQDLFWTASEE